MTDVRDGDGMTPLMVACRRGHYDIVKQLLAFPLPTTFPQTWYGNCLMHDAARRCDFELVEILLEITTDLDSRDRFGKTALMHAIVKADISDKMERQRRSVGRLRTVQLLLEAGADPTLQDSVTGLSIRDYTIKEGDTELMGLLDQVPRRGVSELLA
jgi:ankyrin repeat protein